MLEIEYFPPACMEDHSPMVVVLPYMFVNTPAVWSLNVSLYSALHKVRVMRKESRCCANRRVLSARKVSGLLNGRLSGTEFQTIGLATANIRRPNWCAACILFCSLGHILVSRHLWQHHCRCISRTFKITQQHTLHVTSGKWTCRLTNQNILWKGPEHWSNKSRHSRSIRVLCTDFPVMWLPRPAPLFSSMNSATSAFS